MSSTSPIEPITSEPVIVPSPNDNTNSPQGTVETRLTRLEQSLLPKPPLRTTSPSPTRSRSRSRTRIQVRERRRYNSPPVLDILPILTSSHSLQNYLTTNPNHTDSLVELQSAPNGHMIHLTTMPTHQAELDKIAWVFRTAVEDSWISKMAAGDSSRPDYNSTLLRRRNGVVDYCEDRYDDRYEDRFQRGFTPLVKLGEIFNEGFIPEEDQKDVKFLIVVQGKGNSLWVRLEVSYSKLAALVDIFHALINGYSILFVGAVLVGVDLGNIWKVTVGNGENAFKKVGSVKEARELGVEMVGVIC